MPPWLVALLQQYNSKGFADSLATLVGGHPNYVQMAPQKVSGGIKYGIFGPDASMQPVMQLGLNNKNYSGPHTSGAKLGDFVVAHEFGHMAASGVKNPRLADKLADAIGEDTQESEQFADEFQHVVQFLRPQTTDISKLNPTQRRILDVLLSEPIYKEHPINKQRAFTAMVGKQ